MRCGRKCDADGGGLNDDGSVNWGEVDFKGATVKFGISVDKESGGTFKPAKEYLKGPDASSTDEVLKKVTTRNAQVEADLNMTVEYVELKAEGGYQAVADDIKMKVQGSSADTPDIYNNDMRAFTLSILPGCLMNVVDPVDANGNEVVSYFDFTSDVWNYDFMKEMTFDSSKVYVLACDFHIDMIRLAQVIFVDKTMFDQNGAALGYGDTDTFYRHVKAGDWDYDRLVNMCDVIWQDNGSEKNKADLSDGRIGFVSNERLYFNFVPEMSADVLSEYYEFSLKFKYNSDPSIRMMIDLVYDTIDSPFGIWFESVIYDKVTLSGDTANLHHAISKNSFSQFYEANAEACRIGLQKCLEEFAKVH